MNSGKEPELYGPQEGWLEKPVACIDQRLGKEGAHLVWHGSQKRFTQSIKLWREAGVVLFQAEIVIINVTLDLIRGHREPSIVYTGRQLSCIKSAYKQWLRVCEVIEC